MKLTLRKKDDSRGWPGYILGGRMRTSTVGLVIAFFVTTWLYETYQPPPPEPAPAQQIVAHECGSTQWTCLECVTRRQTICRCMILAIEMSTVHQDMKDLRHKLSFKP